MTKSAQRVINERSGRVVATAVRQAEGAWGTFRGLMLKKLLTEGHGLLFRPARGIHTHFMRFPIDLVFLDEAGTVTKVREAMRPWRFDFTHAAGVIELNAGAVRVSDTQPGDRLRFEPVDPA